jgi:hypothetical protein
MVEMVYVAGAWAWQVPGANASPMPVKTERIFPLPQVTPVPLSLIARIPMKEKS